MRYVLAAALSSAALLPGLADAQVVIMRKPFTVTATGVQTPPTPSPTPTPVPAPTPAPIPQVGTWTLGTPVVASPSCGSAVPATREVWCAATDGTRIPDASCAGTKPLGDTTAPDTRGCTYDWQAAAWSGYSSSCSENAQRSRTVSCVRSDGQAAADGLCDVSKRPETKEVSPIYSSCSYEWKAGEYLDPGSSCTATETQTRSVVCSRTLDGATVDDAQCVGSTRPEATTIVADYSACEYRAVDYGPWRPASTCSADSTKSRTAKCQRSDADGTIVGDAECTSRGVSLTETVPNADYSTCSHSWVAGDFLDPGTSCTATETQTRSVTCQRDLDKSVSDDGLCDAASRPSSTRTVSDYSSCTYGQGTTTDFGDWDSHCSATAKRSRRWSCWRSDGTTMPDSECVSRNIDLDQTETAAVYDGCSYSWTTGDYLSPGPACDPAQTQTRSVTCTRSMDGTTVADSFCTDTRPSSTQTAANYDDCANNLTWYQNSSNVGHMLGEAANGGWYAQPSMGSHHMWYGPYVYRIKPGIRTITWTMQLHDVERDANGVVFLDVYDSATAQQVSGMQILRSNFGANTGFITFTMQYQQTAEMATHAMEYRAYYQGVARVTIASVSVN